MLTLLVQNIEPDAISTPETSLPSEAMSSTDQATIDPVPPLPEGEKAAADRTHPREEELEMASSEPGSSPVNAAAPPTDAVGDAAPTEDLDASQEAGPTPPVGGSQVERSDTQWVEQKIVTLPNARVGQEYMAELGFPTLVVDKYDAGGCGLVRDGMTVGGSPQQSGDFVLTFDGLLEGRRTVITARLAVIPDPRSLWVTIPSDQAGPFAKPDEAADLQKSDDFVCVGASKRGRSHAMTGAFRDDDFGVWFPDGTGWHVIVVADGAGSAPYSREGSRIAVETVLAELPGRLAQRLDDRLPDLSARLPDDQDAIREIRHRLYDCLGNAALNAAKRVEAVVGPEGEGSEAFSTTLIICAARRITREQWFAAAFSIGDGGGVVVDLAGHRLGQLTQPDSGEYAGQTRFLRTAEFSDYTTTMKRIHFEILPSFTAILVMTDGVSDAKLPTEVDFGDIDRWRELWGDLAEAVDLSSDNAREQLLSWLDFWSPGNHDDRTLVILAPSGDER